MSQITWADLMPLFRLILASLEGVGAVRLIAYSKSKIERLTGYPVSGEWALLLTFLICVVLATLTLIVEGILSPETISGGDLVAVFVTVFSAAKVRYDMIKRKAERRHYIIQATDHL